jgi:hypothetical protein
MGTKAACYRCNKKDGECDLLHSLQLEEEMSMKKLMAALSASLLMASASAYAAPSASVFLNGNSFIQAGSVTNDAGSGANLISFRYGLGTPDVGIATWELFGDTATHTDFLSDGVHYQTATWGMSIAPGNIFNFSGLDIDLIESLNPLSVTGSVLDNVGTSLRNAYVSLVWDDQSTATCALNQSPWQTNQTIACVSGGGNNVPEPGTLALAALGLLAFASRRKLMR